MAADVVFCDACQWPIRRLWSLYLGDYWGAEVEDARPFFPAAACIAKPGLLGYGRHTPPSS